MTHLRIMDRAFWYYASVFLMKCQQRYSTKYYIHVTDVILGLRRYANMNSERGNTQHEIRQDTLLICPILRWHPLRIVWTRSFWHILNINVLFPLTLQYLSMYKLCTSSSICTHDLFDEIFINYLLMHYKLTSSTVQHIANYMPQI